MFEWNCEDNRIEKHYNKHVKGINNDNLNEPNLWKTIMTVNCIQDYDNASKKNINVGNSFLYKDYVSKDFSLNYYNKYGSNYLITCVKGKNNNFEIFSCFFKNEILPFIGIYTFVNNMIFENGYPIYIKDFQKNEREEYIYDKCFFNALKNTNLNKPYDDVESKKIIFKINVLIQFLTYHKNIINEMLLKKLIDIKSKQKSKYSLPYSLKQQIKDMHENSNIYDEYRDEIDLLIEICRFVDGEVIVKNFTNEKWNNMFNSFNNYLV